MQNLTIEIISIISVLLILSSIAKLIAKYTKIPSAILLVITGFLISYLTKEHQSVIGQLKTYQGYPDILLYICLPTLIFEAAFSMDTRLLKQNIIPILTLAVPGLFITTTLIGILVSAFTPLNFLTALLLGSILSCTDNVAVIDIFRQLGVPKRLAILVEGESLFNSSTGFVVLKTILFVMFASTFTTESLIIDSIYTFCWNFFGGVLVGLITAFIVSWYMTWIEEETLIVISLTFILAYLSFILAEIVFQVSGVMAAITAGVIMAYWRKTKFTADAEKYASSLLDFVAYLVNSLIFIMVGFSINPTILMNSLPIIMIVIIAMLIARAVMVFGLIPIVSKLPRFVPINWRYQTITWWGGIQGAIGLTMVLSLSNTVPDRELLISIVMGVVVFTIIIQGSLIIKLIHWLRLDRILLSDKFAKLEAEITAENKTLAQIPELQRGGLFSMKIANNLRAKCEKTILIKNIKLHLLEEKEISAEDERKLLILECLSVEKYSYYEMHRKGTLSQQTYLVLNHAVDMKIDSMRFQTGINKHIFTAQLDNIYLVKFHLFENIPILTKLVKWIRIRYSINDYERKWGIHQGCIAVLEYLDTLKAIRLKEGMIQEVKSLFSELNMAVVTYLDNVANQFPEFVNDMQNRFAKRNSLYAKYESITNQVMQGLLSPSVATNITNKYIAQIRKLGPARAEKMNLAPLALLQNVPIFKNIAKSDLLLILPMLSEYHALPGELIIRQGDIDDALYLIARGVIRVIKQKGDESTEIATLMAGDFVGEQALLHHTTRTATCKAITPCILYILKHRDFEVLINQFPEIYDLILKESQKRT